MLYAHSLFAQTSSLLLFSYQQHYRSSRFRSHRSIENTDRWASCRRGWPKPTSRWLVREARWRHSVICYVNARDIGCGGGWKKWSSMAREPERIPQLTPSCASLPGPRASVKRLTFMIQLLYH